MTDTGQQREDTQREMVCVCVWRGGGGGGAQQSYVICVRKLTVFISPDISSVCAHTRILIPDWLKHHQLCLEKNPLILLHWSEMIIYVLQIFVFTLFFLQLLWVYLCV